LLDGKKVSEDIAKSIKIKSKLKLAVILIGDNESSKIYVNMKKRKCEEFGISVDIHEFPENIAETLILDKIGALNADPDVTGILIQLPLPQNLDTRRILDSVSPKKDVDGLTSVNMTRILLGEKGVEPCTPKGVLALLEAYKINIEGKDVCVVGFSNTVGKPLATMCINRGATVTVCHIKTNDLRKHTSKADIIMTATGVPNLIKEDMVKQGAVVVDIGISKVHGKIAGDVDFKNVEKKCSYITPVPGGVGPMTIMMLIQNLVTLGSQ
jgi:methylenetetrahydrofolate dehydrogenase (NADP+) / methenyltetrahydrofolate cyclohydrolase